MFKLWGKIAIVYFVVGVLTLALSLLSFSKSLKNNKAETIETATSTLLTEVSDGTGLTSDELLEIITDINDHYDLISGIIDDIYIYDFEDGCTHDAYGNAVASDKIDFCLADVQYAPGIVYTPYLYASTCIIWFVSSTADIDEAINDIIIPFFLIFPFSYIGLCLITLLPLLIFRKKPKLFKLIYIFVFLWSLMLFILVSFGSVTVKHDMDNSSDERRLAGLENTAAVIATADENMLKTYTYGFRDEDYEYGSSMAPGDAKLAALYTCISYQSQFYTSKSELIPNDNIWNTSLPIKDRVDVRIDYESYARDLTDSFLISVMLGITSALLVGEILSYDKRRLEAFAANASAQDDPFLLKNANIMKFILTVKGFSDVLTVVLTASMLKRFFTLETGSYNNAGGRIIMLGAGLLSCLAIILVPRLARITGNVVGYLRAALFLAGAGALICFTSNGLLMFVIGFFIVSLAGGLFRMVFIIFAMAHNTENAGMFFITYTRRAAVTGQLFGSVIGAMLITIIDIHYMYLIAAVCNIGLIFASLLIKKGSLRKQLPAKTNIPRVLKNKDALLFCAMVIVPFGFQSYFFSYSIPLDAAGLGLTTVVVSFIYFIQNAFRLFFKSNSWGKKMWRSLPLRVSSALCLIITGILFLIYGLLNGVWVMIFTGVLLAYVQSMLNSRIYAYNYTLLGSEIESAFGNSYLIVFGRYIGKSIAPLFVTLFSSVSLPVIMLLSSAAYLFVSRKTKRR